MSNELRIFLTMILPLLIICAVIWFWIRLVRENDMQARRREAARRMVPRVTEPDPISIGDHASICSYCHAQRQAHEEIAAALRDPSNCMCASTASDLAVQFDRVEMHVDPDDVALLERMRYVTMPMVQDLPPPRIPNPPERVSNSALMRELPVAQITNPPRRLTNMERKRLDQIAHSPLYRAGHR